MASMSSEGNVQKVSMIQRATLHYIFFSSAKFFMIGVCYRRTVIVLSDHPR